MARIGYGKIGRSWNLDPAKATSIGGDIDVINALIRLAQDHPEHEFVLVGKNSGEDPAKFGYPSNISNPWTEWKKNWTSVPEPQKADLMIDHFRKISGNMHETLDHMIVWAGQHGSANSRIPMIGSDWITPPGTHTYKPDAAGFAMDEPVTNNGDNDLVTGGEGENLATPQYAFVHYISWYLDFISRWRESGPGPLYREEIWLCPDPRNYLKCREKRWPLRYPVLAQYDFLRYHKGERFGRFPDSLQILDQTGYRENSLWVSNVAYVYSGLELTAVSDPEAVAFDPRPGPHRFGMVVNENLTNVRDSRLELLKTWIFPNFEDAEVRGHWTEKSQLELGKIINPVPYTEALKLMKSFATTITTPASGSEWATTKPWESFAIGSVCFFHPRYDGQGHILPLKDGTRGQAIASEDSKMLAQYLRVNDAAQLKERVDEVTSNHDLYHALVTAQRRHYVQSFKEWRGGTLAISNRIQFDLERIDEGVTIPNTESIGEPWLTYTSPPAAQVQSRVSARPRGTNEERKKKKPPTSRRRALRPGMMEDGILIEDTDVIVASSSGDGRATPVSSTINSTDQTVLDRIDQAVAKTAQIITGFMTNPTTINFSLLADLSPVKSMPEPLTRERLAKDEYFLQMAEHVARRSTCARRSVGCVLVNSLGHVLATGYNGVPAGFPHCNEGNPCSGANSPSGTNMSGCLSPHAESNAWLQCSRTDEVETIYVTTSCCIECVKVALNSGARRIVFREEYVQPEAKELWLRRKDNEWIKL